MRGCPVQQDAANTMPQLLSCFGRVLGLADVRDGAGCRCGARCTLTPHMCCRLILRLVYTQDDDDEFANEEARLKRLQEAKVR